MALIPCPECETKVSDRAKSCPKCGCPIEPKKTTPEPLKPLPAEKPGSFWRMFFRMFLHPRLTVRSITAHQPGFGTIHLAFYLILWMVLSPKLVVSFSKIFGPGPVGFLLAVLLVAVVMAAFFAGYFAALFLIGKLLGGKGSFRDVFTALLWSCVPGVVGGLLAFIKDMGSWPDIIGPVLIGDQPEFFQSYLFFGQHWLGLIADLMGWWSTVLGVICLSESHRISTLRAFLATAAFFAIVMGLVFVFGFSLILSHFLASNGG